MTEIINLNKKRKAMARTEKEKKASQNRLKFGQTKEKKKSEKLKILRERQHLDGHKLETDEDQ